MAINPVGEIYSLGRIIIAIKVYRRCSNDYQNPIANERLDTYLKQHISVGDWVLWHDLQVVERTNLHTLNPAEA